MRGQFHDVRWVLAKNVDASYDVIPFGLVEVTGAEHDRSNRMIVTVKQPASDNPDSFAINGWQPIPVGKYGLVTFEGPVYVAYDTGTPAIGDPWGPQENSFLAKDGNSGLIAFGTTTIGEGKTQKIALMDLVRAGAGGGNRVAYTTTLIPGRVGAVAGGPIAVQPKKLDTSTPPELVNDGDTVQVYSWVESDSSDPGATGFYIFIEQDSHGTWWFTGEDCPPASELE
jgi:hypothetical protein